MATSNKLTGLQRALERGKPEEPDQTPAARRERGGGRSQTPPSREGKTPVTAFLSPEYKRSLRMIQAKHDRKTVQGLIAEALNMLFEHYGVPTVSGE
jgi:hypothetical protein